MQQPQVASAQAQQAERQQKQQEYEEQKRVILRTLLEPAAIERLANIAIVKKERADQIEAYLIQAGARLAGGEKISDAQLLKILEQLAQADTKKLQVVVKRRPDDSDDDW